jgi:predicted Zn-dependent protease
MTDPAGPFVLARAQALLVAGRPEEALTQLGSLPVDDAVGPIGAQLRCHALLQLDRNPEAVEAARAGLAAGGPDPDLLCLLGRAEHECGHLVVAERALLDGLALAPGDVELLCAYADVCAADNQMPKAQRLVDLAAAGRPDAPVVFATPVKVAYARGDDRAAQRISREFVAAHPENAAALALLGGTSAARGRMDEAYAGLSRAAATSPADQAYATAALDLRVATHPLLRPIRPILRFGPVKTWLVAVAVIFLLGRLGLPTLSLAAGLVWVGLCVYSWVVPPLVRRSIRRNWF